MVGEEIVVTMFVASAVVKDFGGLEEDFREHENVSESGGSQQSLFGEVCVFPYFVALDKRILLSGEIDMFPTNWHR